MAAKPAGFAAGEAAVSKSGNCSNVDLPFAMFSHQYESKAIKLYCSMSTISYTPWFSYQINMTLIAHSRIPKNSDRPLAEVTRGAMTARSFQFNIRVQAIKLYYSMSTISYTPWFPYQFKMTLIECFRILKDRPFAWRSDSGPP